MRRLQKASTDGTNLFSILAAQGATGTGTTLDVRAYHDLTLRVSAAATTTLAYKIQGAVASATGTAPDFSAAQTATNHWTYLGSYDLDPATLVVGATGYSLANPTVAASCKLLTVNVDLVDFINVTVTSWTSGNVTIDAIAAND